ncbi:MAG: microcin C ABC transporter permease YejB [Rhodospirillaceae bacterium]|nr:microcin C ABC transporter permease YejB [Rhodospirillaceae bacterium]
MLAYIARRLALIPLTLFGIITVNFLIVQIAPGGPVERMLVQLQGLDAGAGSMTGERSEVSGPRGGTGLNQGSSSYRGAQGLDPALIAQLEKQFGFDRPAHERYLQMLIDFARFDLGESFYKSQSVLSLIADKLPVSLSLGLWSMLIIYGVSIPLGIRKAVRDGTTFDAATSTAIFIGYAVPGFLFALVLIVVFAGGRYLDWFPLRGLVSENWADLSWAGKIADYLWHMVLPVTALTIGGLAQLTMLAKNTFLEEINKQYVLTARAKGLSETQVLYGHVFRNAMLLVIAGFPAALIATLFTGALLIEVMFSLDGLGLLSFEAIVNRDYPVVFGSLYVFSLIGLLLNVITDIAYHAVDPRIDFESRARG